MCSGAGLRPLVAIPVVGKAARSSTPDGTAKPNILITNVKSISTIRPAERGCTPTHQPHPSLAPDTVEIHAIHDSCRQTDLLSSPGALWFALASSENDRRSPSPLAMPTATKESRDLGWALSFDRPDPSPERERPSAPLPFIDIADRSVVSPPPPLHPLLRPVPRRPPVTPLATRALRPIGVESARVITRVITQPTIRRVPGPSIIAKRGRPVVKLAIPKAFLGPRPLCFSPTIERRIDQLLIDDMGAPLTV
eukprot:tig00021435_g21418.t1